MKKEKSVEGPIAKYNKASRVLQVLMVIALIGIFIFPFIKLVSAAIIWYQTSTATITIKEPLVTPSQDYTPDFFPGQTYYQNITIKNLAPVNEYTTLTWHEIANPSNLSYSTTMNGDRLTMTPGDNIVTLSWTGALNSNNGTGLKGNISFNRVS